MPDVTLGIVELCRAIAGPDGSVGFATPAYPPFLREPAANPHNPTGRVLPRSELTAIAQRCAEREVWVLADEIHAPLQR